MLADPEGNEFCVIEPGNRFLDGCGFIGAVACDGSQAAGYFWSQALGWLGRLNGLLPVTSFGMAPVSVLLAAWFEGALGPSAFFLFAGVTIAAAVIGGLTWRSWRDFGAASPAGGSARPGASMAGTAREESGAPASATAPG